MSFTKHPIALTVFFAFLLVTFLYALPPNEQPKAVFTKDDLEKTFRDEVSKNLPVTKVELSEDAAKKLETLIKTAAEKAVSQNFTDEDLNTTKANIKKLAANLLSKGKSEPVRVTQQDVCGSSRLAFPLCLIRLPAIKKNQNTNINTSVNANFNTDNPPNNNTLSRNHFLKNRMISSFKAVEVDKDTILTFERTEIGDKDVEAALNIFCPGLFPFC